MRIGIFGGTFDPPHYGHLSLASAARDQLGLDKVLWVVTADPPHKQDQRITPVDDRLAMVEAAIAGEPTFEVSRVDIDRPGPHWTADTVALLAEQYPGDELIYLMGEDSLADLPTWGRPEELLRCCTLGVMRRPGDDVDLAELEPALPGIAARVAFIDLPELPISSQDIRRRVAIGQRLDGLTPPPVAEMIHARGLYRVGEWR